MDWAGPGRAVGLCFKHCCSCLLATPLVSYPGKLELSWAKLLALMTMLFWPDHSRLCFSYYWQLTSLI